MSGSYSTGNQNKFSDIDVAIVASNDIGWQEKSSRWVDGFLIEYTINPLYKVQEYMKSDLERHRMINQNMYTYGKILHDKNGVMKKLRGQSVRELNKKFKPYSKYTRDFIKFHLWDQYDELQSLQHDGYHIDLTYWVLVGDLVNAYCDFKCIPHIALTKIEKILTDKKFAQKYHATEVPDKKFATLLMDCFNAKSKQNKMTAIDKLYNYVMAADGGFEIGKFVGRHKIEKR